MQARTPKRKLPTSYLLTTNTQNPLNHGSITHLRPPANPRHPKAGAPYEPSHGLHANGGPGLFAHHLFMLSTTLAKPQIMPLVMPDDDGGEHQALKHSKALTLLLGSENKVLLV